MQMCQGFVGHVMSHLKSDDPFHECRFLSMADINAKSRLALGLYKPEEYGLEMQLEGLSDIELDDLKIEAHNNLK